MNLRSIWSDLRSEHSVGEAIQIHFVGCGAAFPYSIGYAAALKDSHYLRRVTHLSGGSSGALIAAIIATGADIEAPVRLAFRYQRIVENRVMGLVGVWKSLLERYYTRVLPSDFAYSELKTLHVLLTRVTGRSEFASRFRDRADLIRALLASQHIPFFLDGRPWANYHGKRYIDGQLLQRNVQLAGARCHVVSPWLQGTRRTSVRVVETFTRKNRTRLMSLMDEGYRDGKTWLGTAKE